MLSYQLHYANHKEGLQSSIERSTVQDGVVMIAAMIALSIVMIHHKTSGPLYHYFVSLALVWDKSMAS